MADAVLLFPPGFQVKNATGVVQSGAVLRAFDAGTTDARVFYSDPGLTTSLGTSVTCNAAGRPASGATEVLLYASEGNLKISAETSGAVALWTFDNVQGALDLTALAQGSEAIPNHPVITKTGDYTVLEADQGKLIVVNAAGTTTITLPSAVTVGDGWSVSVKNVHDTGQVLIDADGSETIDGEAARTLPITDEAVSIVSDGANWHIKADYLPAETVSWTPAWGFNNTVYTTEGVVYSARGATAIKRGHQVFAAGRMTISNNGSVTGGAFITGLPWVAVGPSAARSAVTLTPTTWAAKFIPSAYVAGDTNLIVMSHMTTTSGYKARSVAAHIPDSSTIAFNVTYYATE